MQNERENRAPRLNRPARIRNDARTLLRSRGVQAVLVCGTLVQAGVISKAVHDRGEQPPVAVHGPIRPLAPVQPGARPAEVAALKLVDGSTAAVRSRKETHTAELLARKYRARGYKVSDGLARQIHEAATEHGIDPQIAFGLVRTESGFRNTATSHVGAMGLTQLMPATARWVEPGTTRSDLRDSETNLRIGFRYLRDLIRKYDGDTTLALLAYNRGPGTVDRALRRGRNPDNGYADMVRGLRTTHR